MHSKLMFSFQKVNGAKVGWPFTGKVWGTYDLKQVSKLTTLSSESSGSASSTGTSDPLSSMSPFLYAITAGTPAFSISASS